MFKKLLISFLLVNTVYAVTENSKYKYDFNPEYEYEQSSGYKADIVTLNNKFAVNQNISLGANIQFLRTRNEKQNSGYYELFLKNSLLKMQNYNLKTQNRLRISREDYSDFYELRLINEGNFLQTDLRFDVGYRRFFSKFTPDILRLDPLINFNINEKISFIVRGENGIAMTGEDKNRFLYMQIYFGPSFAVDSKTSIYINLRYDYGGKYNQYTKGFVVGYNYTY